MAHELMHLDIFDDTVFSYSCNSLEKKEIVSIVSDSINKTTSPLESYVFLPT